MKNYENIIKENVNQYLSKQLIKEYNNIDLIQYLEYGINSVCDAFNLIEQDIKNHKNDWHYSSHEYIIEKLRNDIGELLKDIKIIKNKKL